jgi:hypothetical protein
METSMVLKIALLGAGITVNAVWAQPNMSGTARPGPLGWEAHGKALEAVTSLESPAREAALKSLVKTASEGLATDAMVQLIRRHVLDIEPLAIGLVPTLSDLNVRHLLAAAASTRDAALKMALSRAVLEQAGVEVKPVGAEMSAIAGQDTVGFAAMLLAESRERPDKDLVGSIVRKLPHNSGLWLALAKMDFSNAEERSLARSVVQDGRVLRWARLSAATMLAPRDTDARKLVTDALTSFLTTFGHKDLGALIIQMYSQGPNGPPLLRPGESQYGLRIISLLEFLQIPDAERLTFEFLDANNLWVRGALGLLAAKRWPDRLLGTALSHDDERVKLLAALSVLHPELLSRVQALVPAETLDTLRSRLIDTGVELAFSLPGNAGLVF